MSCDFTAAKAATTYIDFASGDGRKALRRCPDLSRKRDGIVVRALSFLPFPLVEANCLSRSAPLDREDRRLRHARRRRRHVRGVTESLPYVRRIQRRFKSSAEHTASETFCVCHSRQRSQPPRPPKLPQRIKRTFLKIMLAS